MYTCTVDKTGFDAGGGGPAGGAGGQHVPRPLVGGCRQLGNSQDWHQQALQVRVVQAENKQEDDPSTRGAYF